MGKMYKCRHPGTCREANRCATSPSAHFSQLFCNVLPEILTSWGVSRDCAIRVNVVVVSQVTLRKAPRWSRSADISLMQIFNIVSPVFAGRSDCVRVSTLSGLFTAWTARGEVEVEEPGAQDQSKCSILRSDQANSSH